MSRLSIRFVPFKTWNSAQKIPCTAQAAQGIFTSCSSGCDMHTAYASHFFNSSSHLLSVSFRKVSRRCSLPGAKRCFNLPCFFQKLSRKNRSFLHYSARYKETRFVKLLIMVFSSIASVKYPSSSSIISICNSLGIFFSGIAPSISSLSVFRSASLSI